LPIDICLHLRCVGVGMVLVFLLILLSHPSSIGAQLLYTDEVLEVSISSGSANANSTQFYAPAKAHSIEFGSVKWTNHDNVIHTVTEGKPSNATASPEFNSGPINPGDTFVHFFDETGSVDYYCSIHPHMLGKVIVNSPGTYN
jgi:plastocyanin